MGKKKKNKTDDADGFDDMKHPHTISMSSICPNGYVSASITLDDPSPAQVAASAEKVAEAIKALHGTAGPRSRPRADGGQGNRFSMFGPFDPRSFGGGGLPEGVLLFPPRPPRR